MLHITKMVRKFTKHLSLAEWSFIKLDLIIVGLLLAKWFPVLTALHWGWYIAFIIIVEIYFLRKLSGLVKK